MDDNETKQLEESGEFRWTMSGFIARKAVRQVTSEEQIMKTGHAPIEFPTNHDGILKLAFAEGDSCISVGGLVKNH